MSPLERQPVALPSVSIITVVWNDLAGLQATTSAIRALAYPHLKHVIVDGASTDGTPAWLAAQAGANTHWVSEPDKGLYDAMNKGLAMATGEFVWFINAGDFPYSAVILTEAFAGWQGEDVLYGQTELIDITGASLGLRSHKKLPKQLRLRDMRLGMVVSHQSLIVRRALAPTYDTRYRIAADIDWTVRLLKQTSRTRNTGLVLSKFLVGGTSAQRRRQSWVERFRLLRVHFGLGPTLLAHAEIALRALLGKP
jgi:glycosyltransferase involved in cell wall biosynthesis